MNGQLRLTDEELAALHGHTEGPWAVDGAGADGAVLAANGNDVALITTCGGRAVADTRLVAAAPQLLAEVIESRKAISTLLKAIDEHVIEVTSTLTEHAP